MTRLHSIVRLAGPIDIPAFSGVRWMMMPVRLEDPETVPEPYRRAFAQMVGYAPASTGTGYLTVDECDLTAGDVHRRPGLHVDGMGAWGGGGSPWAAKGMLVASSDGACRAWNQTLMGRPTDDGDCEHLRDQLRDPIHMLPSVAYWCSPLAIHEALAVERSAPRQFVRLSMPSDAPWFEGYTPSPYGVAPGGPVLPRRSPQMAYRGSP